MGKLYNCISKKLLKKKKQNARINVSFYKYFKIYSPLEFRNWVYINFLKLNIYGRIYISYEGINAQLSILKCNFNKMKKILLSFSKDFKKILFNTSINTELSFWFLKVKIKKKILFDGVDNFFLNYKKKKKIKAKFINDYIISSSFLIIDLRNNYEYSIGHFKKSFTVPSSTFREQLKKIVNMFKYAKNDPIIIYCTGGIRCSKACLWMRYNGYKNIYQVKGGIVKYFFDTKKYKLPIFFKGSNFVFDLRLLENISNIKSYCWQCYHLCHIYKNCKNNFCHKLFIQCVTCFKKFGNYCSFSCKKNKLNINI